MFEKVHINKRVMHILSSLLFCVVMMARYSNLKDEQIVVDKADKYMVTPQIVGTIVEDSLNIKRAGLDLLPLTGDMLVIQTTSNDIYRVELNIPKISIDLPFSITYARLEVISGTDTQITMNRVNTRSYNYTFGLGANYLDVGITRVSKDYRKSSSHILVEINRLSRVQKFSGEPKAICFLEQDCDLIIYQGKKCGLQDTTPTDVSTGYWKLMCNSCNDELTCNWDTGQWVEAGDDNYRRNITDSQLRENLANKKLLFLGDSTNRGIMQELMERANGTLYHAVKSHHYIMYERVGSNTRFSFMYYPAFWLDSWPTFVQALYNISERSDIRSGQMDDVYLIIGGVQWLTIHQLQEVSKFVDRYNIPANHVIVKTHSSGFHYPVPNIPYVHDQKSLQKILKQNDKLKQDAISRGFTVVDTLQMTLSRYREFLQGKCACHFHQVTEYKEIEVLNDKTDYKSSEVRTKLKQLGLIEDNSQMLYHISGPIHEAYTDMIIKYLI